jgi:hypothetical protein
MMGRRLFVLLAVIALFGLPFADCLSAMSHDDQSMQCCGSMPCDPSNQSHDCCKGMVSAQAPNVLPVAHVTLDAPVMIVTGMLGSQMTPQRQLTHVDFAAPQHSPPELYTLHASLLI